MRFSRCLLAAALIAGCQSNPNDVPLAPAASTATLPAQTYEAPPPSVMPPAVAESAAVKTALSDAEIAAIAGTANQIEIDQAKIAKAQSKNKDVQAFAAMMIKDHQKAGSDAKALLQKIDIKPEDSDATSEMLADNVTTSTRLSGLTGPDFDRFYVNTQIDEHQKVLDDLDQMLIPGAENAQLKSMLESIRPVVADHLAAAQALAKQLATPMPNEQK
jgi:putative membrane protein